MNSVLTLPKLNKPCAMHEFQRSRSIQKSKLASVQPLVNSSSPNCLTKKIPYEKKKLLNNEQKFTEIERENRILLEKMTNIFLRNKKDENNQISPEKNIFKNKQINRPVTYWQQEHLLKQRLKRASSINQQNNKLQQRIKSSVSHYKISNILKLSNKQLPIFHKRLQTEPTQLEVDEHKQYRKTPFLKQIQRNHLIFYEDQLEQNEKIQIKLYLQDQNFVIERVENDQKQKIILEKQEGLNLLYNQFEGNINKLADSIRNKELLI